MWLFALLLCADSATLAVPVAPTETLRVAVTGSGAPVVLVPGLFGSALGFRRVAAQLRAVGFRAIVIEPLGLGSSGRPAHADYSLTAQADRIAAVLDTLGVQGAIVVAHSLGASMAFRLAYRRPELVRAIVSLEGGPAEAAATPSFRRAMRFAPWIKWFGGVRRIQAAVRRSLVAASGDTSWVTDSVVSAYTAGAAADLDGTLKAFLRMAQAREREQLATHLGGVRCPVRLLVGTAPHQGSVPFAEVDELRRSLSDFAVDSVAGSGHYVFEEQPGTIVTAVQALDAGSGRVRRYRERSAAPGRGNRGRIMSRATGAAAGAVVAAGGSIVSVYAPVAPARAVDGIMESTSAWLDALV